MAIVGVVFWALMMAQDPFPPSGEELVARVEAGFKKGVQNEESVLKIIIIDARGKENVKELRYVVAYSADGDRRLLRFQKPPESAGTGLLNIEHRDRPDEQYLFLKSIGRAQKIAPRARSTPFVGTHYSIGDTRSENMTMWTYGACVDEEVAIAGEKFPCWRLTATAKESAETAYTKRILWIDRSFPILIKEEMYNNRGLWKTRVRWKVAPVTIGADHTVPRSVFEEMIDHPAGAKTRLEVLSRKFNQRFSADPFTVRELEKSR